MHTTSTTTQCILIHCQKPRLIHFLRLEFTQKKVKIINAILLINNRTTLMNSKYSLEILSSKGSYYERQWKTNPDN